MTDITVAGKKIQLDDEYFLVHEEDWNPEVAKEIAKRLDIDDLDEAKIKIIEFMREYYHKFNAFPILNYVCKYVEQPKQCLNHEFVNPMNAWKIAGLPKLDGIHFITVDGKNYQMEECC